MTRILIFDGAPKAGQDELARFGCPTNRRMFETALRRHDPDVACTTVNVADGESLPAGTSPQDFDGVVITGSPLNVYEPVPAVTRQIELARDPARNRPTGLGLVLGPAARRHRARRRCPAEPAWA